MKRIELARYGLEYTEHIPAYRRHNKEGNYVAAESEMKEAIGVMLIAKTLPGPPAFSHVGQEIQPRKYLAWPPTTGTARQNKK